MKRIILFFKVFFVCFCFNTSAKAVAYDSIQVYLLTCEPHDEIYSLYGHTAIRVVNPSNNMDIVVNYGAFDTTSKNFVLRFIFGLTDYMMMVYDYSDFLAEYRYFGSAVHQQHINMSAEEKRVFTAALAESARPENITYRYNYFYNNCTTKARDIILNSISGEKSVELPSPPEQSFRDLIHAKTVNHPWAAWGNDFLLGVLADMNTTIYEAEFIPDCLMRDFDHTVVRDFDGNKRKLVTQNTVVLQSGRPFRSGMPDFPLSPLVALGLLASVIVLWSIAKRFFTLHSSFFTLHSSLFTYIDYAVCCLYAAPGLLLACMIFSQHPAVSLNFQILVFNPLLFWLAWPKCKVRWRWEIILGCVLLFMVLGLVQSYAEGVLFLGMALGCLALSNMNLRKNALPFHLPSSIILLTSSVILLASCHSSSKVAKDDVYAVGKPAKHETKHGGKHESGHADLYGSSGILAQAQSLLGSRYRSGGNTPEGFDCSGFTNYVFGLNNINIGRSSRDQFAQNTPIQRDQIRPGDLVFFSGTRLGSGVGHVGIVMDVDKSADTFTFIHSSSRGGVVISRSTDEYYARRYLGVRRVKIL